MQMWARRLIALGERPLWGGTSRWRRLRPPAALPGRGCVKTLSRTPSRGKQHPLHVALARGGDETRTPADVPQGKKWVYDHPFFLILNVAVGGTWPGSPDASTAWPAQMLVDYVRVYKAN